MPPNVRLSAAQFRGALDGLLEGVQIIDRDLRYVYVNPAAAAQGRMRVVDVVGRRLEEIFPGAGQSDYARSLREVLASGVPQSMRTSFALADGTVGHYQLSIEPIEDGLFVLSVELTAQMRAEAALADTNDRYRGLLVGLPDLVFLLDRSRQVLDLHVPDTAPLFVPKDRIIGRSLLALLPPALATRAAEALHRAVESGRPQTLQYEFPMPDGMHHFEATAVRGEAGRLTIVARDVTARVELEHQLRQAQKMEAIGQLTGGIAHDFNNVLQIITANADLLAQEAVERDVPISAELADILTASRRGADMVAQLLQFSRRGVLRRQLADPRPLLTRLMGMLKRLMPSSVRLELPELPSNVTLSLDTGALEQIVTNLCTNARDAMPTGGTITIRGDTLPLDETLAASFPWLAPGSYFRLGVRDSGVGMSDETMQRVFEPFYTTKEVGVGTGLGMAMVYGLMKSHDGAVEVRSVLGEGTEVLLYFPVVDAPPYREDRSLSPASARAPGGGETILLVEDDPAIRSVMRRGLELKGYRVIEAADGASGLAEFRLRQHAIQLVITDLVMPQLGGRQMADAIRAEAPAMPLLFTSGYSSHAFFGEAGMPNDLHFLPKPWTLSDLLTQVRRALDGGVAGG